MGKKKMHPCPCCGNLTYPVPPEEDVGYICDVCWWENDPFIQSDDQPSDQNHGMTLRQGKENYQKYGISAPHLMQAWRNRQELPAADRQAAGRMRKNLFGTVAEIDLKATIGWYSQGYRWGCGCDDCRNFLRLAHELRLPQKMTELLAGLGILPEQATYLCELYPTQDGKCYQVSYRLAGCMPDGPGEAIALEWGEARCCHESYPYGAPGFPEPHFDLEFSLSLPWVLEKTDQ